MRVLVVSLLLAALLLAAQAKKKPGNKPNKPSKPSKPSCQADSINTKQFYKYTETKKVGKGKKAKVVPVANQPCWWDPSRSDCGKCKAKGKQCGFPMHAWCQNPKKKTGCPGIPGFKNTLSSQGAACMSDHSDQSCAWCVKNRKQCPGSKQADKCGNFCAAANDQTCDGNPFNCDMIPACGFGASCDAKTKACKCGKKYTGNGYKCYDAAGALLTPPQPSVNLAINTSTKFVVMPHSDI